MGTANILNNYRIYLQERFKWVRPCVFVMEKVVTHSALVKRGAFLIVSHVQKNSNFTLYIQIKGNVSQIPVLKVVFLILQNSNFVFEDHQQDFYQ